MSSFNFTRPRSLRFGCGDDGLYISLAPCIGDGADGGNIADITVPDCTDRLQVDLNHTITYSSICGYNPGEFTFVSSSLIRGFAAIPLHDHFYLEEMWDGVCPLAWAGRNEREHPALGLVIGPYEKDVELFAATNLFCDDVLRIDGVEIARLGETICKNTVLKTLPASSTATVRAYDKGGAWCFAAGYIGVRLLACPGKDIDCSDVPPDGWEEVGITIGSDPVLYPSDPPPEPTGTGTGTPTPTPPTPTPTPEPTGTGTGTPTPEPPTPTPTPTEPPTPTPTPTPTLPPCDPCVYTPSCSIGDVEYDCEPCVGVAAGPYTIDCDTLCSRVASLTIGNNTCIFENEFRACGIQSIIDDIMANCPERNYTISLNDLDTCASEPVGNNTCGCSGIITVMREADDACI